MPLGKYFTLFTIAGIRFKIEASDEGITRIDFNPQSEFPESDLKHISKGDERLFGIYTQLQEYFNGKRKNFTVPVEFSADKFTAKVWRELLRIPYGKTASYREIAERIKHPNAYRAVGTANGKNPLPIIIPCHRVISADGSIGGYSAGIEVKRKLLETEGIQL